MKECRRDSWIYNFLEKNLHRFPLFGNGLFLLCFKKIVDKLLVVEFYRVAGNVVINGADKDHFYSAHNNAYEQEQ